MKLKILAATFLLAPFGLMMPANAGNPYHVQRLLETKACEGCDLTNARLSGKDLSSANLVGADLTNADLRDTILVGADLTLAILRKANLNNAILNGANLSGTDLSFANLSNASLLRVDVSLWGGVELTGANLSGTMMPDGTVRDRDGKINQSDLTTQEPGRVLRESAPPAIPAEEDDKPRQPSARTQD